MLQSKLSTGRYVLPVSARTQPNRWSLTSGSMMDGTPFYQVKGNFTSECVASAIRAKCIQHDSQVVLRICKKKIVVTPEMTVADICTAIRLRTSR